MEADRFIRLAEVEDLIGLKCTSIYQMIKDGNFPQPMKLGRASRWSLVAVRRWMAAAATNQAA